MYIIDDVNTTIEKLFEQEYGGTLPFDISFAVPNKNFTTVSTDKPTVNFYLFDIRKNTKLSSIGQKNAGSKPATRIQIAYCITAWSPMQEDPRGSKTREEHKLLSEILQLLLKYPKMPENALQGSIKGQQPLPPATIALPDSMENNGQFWSSLEGTLKPFLEFKTTVQMS